MSGCALGEVQWLVIGGNDMIHDICNDLQTFGFMILYRRFIEVELLNSLDLMQMYIFTL